MLEPFFLLVTTLVPLLLIERWIHRHLQGVALLIAGDRDVAVVLYALPLLPGVLIHELSHALAAVLLGAKVGRISILPKAKDGRVQLGVVPVERTGSVRASLIGLAPLLAGSAVILLIGRWAFGLDTVGAALAALDLSGLSAGLIEGLQVSDAWLWAYVIFTVSNTMFPSRTDREAWMPVLLFLVLIGALVWIIGLGPTVIGGLSQPVTLALQGLAAMCALTIAVDLPFALLIVLLEKLVERIKGVRVAYGG